MKENQLCAGCFYGEVEACLLPVDEPCPKILKEEYPREKQEIPINYDAVETD